MKKAFTLLAIAALVTTASIAQRHGDDDYCNDRGREVAANHHGGGNDYGRGRGTYIFTEREKNMQLFSINREYNGRVESVKRKLFMGRAKKEQLIWSMELQRNGDIRSVRATFDDRKPFDNSVIVMTGNNCS
ncbi:MAG: hypothetical protein WKI04_18280 [Ferruginibacter sp.]